MINSGGGGHKLITREDNTIKRKFNVEGPMTRVIRPRQPLRKKQKKHRDLTLVKMTEPMILIMRPMYPCKKKTNKNIL